MLCCFLHCCDMGHYSCVAKECCHVVLLFTLLLHGSLQLCGQGVLSCCVAFYIAVTWVTTVVWPRSAVMLCCFLHCCDMGHYSCVAKECYHVVLLFTLL